MHIRIKCRHLTVVEVYSGARVCIAVSFRSDWTVLGHDAGPKRDKITVQRFFGTIIWSLVKKNSKLESHHKDERRCCGQA